MLYHMHYICVLFIFQQILVYEIIDITLDNVQVSKANNLQTVYIGIMHCKGSFHYTHYQIHENVTFVMKNVNRKF